MTDIDIDAARAVCTGVNATEKRMIGQVVGALGVHRWKSMGVGTVECECGAVVTGEWPHDSDEAFRWHLAHVVLDSLPFIAAARDLVPALLDEVERLDLTLTQTERDYRTVAAECASATTRALDYKDEVERLRISVGNWEARHRHVYGTAEAFEAERDEARAAVARVEALCVSQYALTTGFLKPADVRAALRGDES